MATPSIQHLIEPGLTQRIMFSDSDANEYGAKISGQFVNIQCGDGNHTIGSSKVQLADRVNYNWELKYYYGQIIAAHISGNIVAFSMKGKDGSMIRVFDQANTEKKTLIKYLKGDIKDLAFSFCRTEIILGCIDSVGNILIYHVKETSDSINCSLSCHIFHQEEVGSDTKFRLIWCPYVPNYDDDEVEVGEEPDKMFVVLNGMKAEIYNVGVISKKYGNQFPIDPKEDYDGYIEINHCSEINSAYFSLDGTAVAIACQDGFVKFFQLYISEKPKQKCLHQWTPHNGKPLSAILFIDNVLDYSPECWKFTITAAKNNSEIKLWSCESWECLQTITFFPNPKSKVTDLFLKISLDFTGQFIIVSDINNNGVYVMQLKRTSGTEIAVNQLYHFLVPASFLSLHIVSAEIKKIPFYFDNMESDDIYDNDMEYLDDSSEIGEMTVFILKMLIIQPKKFQECCIRFQIEDLLGKGAPAVENTANQLIDLKDLDDNDNEDEDTIQKMPELDDLQNSVNLLIQQQQLENSNPKLTLMTPDDFTSSGKNSKSSSIRNSMTNENILDAPIEKLSDNKLNDFQRPQKDNSGGSSPSREVQEILSVNNSSVDCSTQEYFSNFANLEDAQEHPQKDYSAPAENNILYPDALNWPKMPIVKNSDVIKQINETSQLSNQDLETVYIRINTLETMIREQKSVLEQFHQDLKAINQKLTSSSNNVGKADFVQELDAAMSKQHLQIAQMLENLIQMQKQKDRELQEGLLATVNQMLSKSLCEKIQYGLQHEIKHSVLPLVHQLMESYRHQIDTAYTQKFTNIDAMIKENFAKVISNKSLTESISVSVVNLICPSLEKCYKDIIMQTLIPSWERICNQMFHQICDTFTKGTKEYTASVETYMEKQRKVQDKGKDLVTHMQGVSDVMKSNTEKLSEILSTEIQKQFSLVFKNIQDKMIINVKDVVSSEIKQGFKNQAAVLEEGVINAVRSRTVTPAPHADPHRTILSQIQQAITKKNYEEAFMVALSAANLTYVIFVCERVDINRVFSEKCQLTQNVVLALIQQLSMELNTNSEIKLTFLREAFLALSPDQQQSKDFIPAALRNLHIQLVTFMQSNPPLKQMTEARLLNMAVEGMLKK